MPYMQSACVQFSHEQNIYGSAGALFIHCLSTVVSQCVVRYRRYLRKYRDAPPLFTPYCMEQYLAKISLLKLLLRIELKHKLIRPSAEKIRLLIESGRHTSSIAERVVLSRSLVSGVRALMSKDVDRLRLIRGRGRPLPAGRETSDVAELLAPSAIAESKLTVIRSSGASLSRRIIIISHSFHALASAAAHAHILHRP